MDTQDVDREKSSFCQQADAIVYGGGMEYPEFIPVCGFVWIFLSILFSVVVLIHMSAFMSLLYLFMFNIKLLNIKERCRGTGISISVSVTPAVENP